MSEEIHQNRSPSCTDSPVRETRGLWGLVVLVVLNGVAGIGSLWLIPLVVHVFSCTSGERWCRLMAGVWGVPAGLVVAVLGVLTAACSLRANPAARSVRCLTRAAWLPLLVAASVVGALILAILCNP